MQYISAKRFASSTFLTEKIFFKKSIKFTEIPLKSTFFEIVYFDIICQEMNLVILSNQFCNRQAFVLPKIDF